MTALDLTGGRSTSAACHLLESGYMSERKVLNKYIPPNFDPSRIPKRIVPKEKQHTVRLMTPYSMRCNSCGEYIYKGRKFNARKETVEGEEYLGIRIFRFYIRCPVCGAEITYKTDPKNADYKAEHGATRNFEPWREELKEGEEAKNRRLMEEMYNPMKALENKTYDSKRELDILENLDDIRLAKTRLEQVDTDAAFVRVASKPDEEALQRALEEAEDDELAHKAFASKRAAEQVEYENWTGEGEDEIISEEPLELVSNGVTANASQAIAKDCGVEPELIPVIVPAPKVEVILGNTNLSKIKKQALLGIVPKKPRFSP